jgi:hypothetical protein
MQPNTVVAEAAVRIQNERLRTSVATTSSYKTDYVDIDDDGNLDVPAGWSVLQVIEVIDVQPGCIKVLLRRDVRTENPFE